ncbi:MAG: DNA cytosine methyltransferase [Defluviitaleaceae bacterium]|nr:DNA cytosine methyltransferase [Defluviitaleaceae bacterium]
MQKTSIDLFAGCGGLSLGLEQAGFKTLFATDISPICANTYVENLAIDKNCFFICDINTIVEDYKYIKYFNDIDLISGGPPCQGFSMANRQRIIDDPRNVLYKSYLGILKKARPRFFIMENVKGMKNKIEEILDDFDKALGIEYNFSFDIINAKDYGIPQHRERLFLIGNRVGVDSSKLFERIHENKRKPFTLESAIVDLPPLGVNENKNRTAVENNIIGYTKTDFSYKIDDFYKFINGDREIKFLYNHKNRYNNKRDIEIFSRLPQGENSLHQSIADIMPYKTRNHIFKDKYFKLKYDEVCKTITSHMKFDCNMYIHPTQARGLSPREAARIQTFPDDFVFTGPQNSWYMQIGNAVPVQLAKIIGGEIIKCL